MIRPQDVPNTAWRILRREADFGRSDAGWLAPNQIAPRDCIPTYRLPGGGIQQQELTDLPEAIEQCIYNILARKSECDRLIQTLRGVQDELKEH